MSDSEHESEHEHESDSGSENESENEKCIVCGIESANKKEYQNFGICSECQGCVCDWCTTLCDGCGCWICENCDSDMCDICILKRKRWKRLRLKKCILKHLSALK